MHVLVVWGRLRLGAWDQYEQFYNNRITPSAREIKGLHDRQLLRSTEDPDEGMSISQWDTEEDLLNYIRSPLRESLAKEVEHLYRGDFWVKHFQVRGT